MESNDSPEIPDRGETSDIPGLPSGTAAVEATTAVVVVVAAATTAVVVVAVAIAVEIVVVAAAVEVAQGTKVVPHFHDFA